MKSVKVSSKTKVFVYFLSNVYIRHPEANVTVHTQLYSDLYIQSI